MNTQINEDYRFRMAYVRELLREIFGTVNVIEDANLEDKINEIRRQEDNSYIENLEKDMRNFGKRKEPKIKSSKFNTENVKNEIQAIDFKEQTEEMIAKELEDDEEKEL